MKRRASDQPQLLVGIAQRGRGFHRVAARHRQVEPLAREDFGDGDNLQAIILAGEQGVLELACGASFHDDFAGKGELVGLLVEDYPIGKYRGHPSGRQHLEHRLKNIADCGAFSECDGRGGAVIQVADGKSFRLIGTGAKVGLKAKGVWKELLQAQQRF